MRRIILLLQKQRHGASFSTCTSGSNAGYRWIQVHLGLYRKLQTSQNYKDHRSHKKQRMEQHKIKAFEAFKL